MWILYWMQLSAPLSSCVWLIGLMRYFLIQKGRFSWSIAIASHSFFNTWFRSASLSHLHSAKMIRRFDGFGSAGGVAGRPEGTGWTGSPAEGKPKT